MKTTIIIPNYNGLSFMEPCFEALEKQTTKDFKILVVDNGSTDGSVEWLKERNIPIFSPLSMLETQEEWESDPMGMFGGFMSQSIVVPELDGAIYPYVLNDQELDEEGIYLFKAIPEPLKNLTRIIGNFILRLM